MPASELATWRAFFEDEWARSFGWLACIHLNANRDRTKRPQPFVPDDFLGYVDESTELETFLENLDEWAEHGGSSDANG